MNPKPRLEPAQALRLVTQALGGSISIPLSAVRHRVAGISEKVELDISEAPPGVRVRGQAHALGAPIAFSARIEADGVDVRGEQRTVRLRGLCRVVSQPDPESIVDRLPAFVGVNLDQADIEQS